MRFLGTWIASLVAVVLVAVLVLGRDATPRTYEVSAIADAFQPRYAAALADLEAGGVLYLRSELRDNSDDDGDAVSVKVLETWVARSGDVSVARSEWSELDGSVLQVTEIEGWTQTLLIDHVAGTESRVPTTVLWVRAPAKLLAGLWDSTLGAAPRDGIVVGAAPIAGLESAGIAVPGLARSRISFAISNPLIHRQEGLDRDGDEVRSELALLEWVVLPAATELGTRPD